MTSHIIVVDPGAGDRTVVCFKADRVIIEDVLSGVRYEWREVTPVRVTRIGGGAYELMPYEVKMIAEQQAKRVEEFCRQCGL